MANAATQIITLVIPASILTLISFLMVLVPTDFGEDQTKSAKVYQSFSLLATGFLTITISLVAFMGQGIITGLDLHRIEKVNDSALFTFIMGIICIFVALGVYVSRFYHSNIWIIVLVMAVLWFAYMLYAMIQIARTWNE